jgi:exopolysaccharide biosynthesis polyprenyl glycosylphosphotransferase
VKLFGIPYEQRQLYYTAGDVLAAMLAIYLAHAIRFGPGSADANPGDILVQQATTSLFFVSSSVVALYLVDAYNTSIDFRRPRELLRLWGAVAISLWVQVGTYFLFPEAWWGRGIAGLTSIGLGVVLSVSRPLLCWWRPGPVFRVRTLVVGEGEAGNIIAQEIRSNPEYRRVYDLVGALTYPRFGSRRAGDEVSGAFEVKPIPGLAHLGTVGDLTRVVRERPIGLIIVAIRGGMSAGLATQLLECKAMGIQIEEMPTIYKRITGKVPILHVNDAWLIFGPVFYGASRFASAIQRLLDVLLSVFGLLLSAPVIAVAAVCVKLESRGPAFFWQERLGRNEVPFEIVKLRTMREDAEAISGAVWSQGASDPRVTRVGRLLRRTRIDELPQFYNVLRGDMSIVGPRPEREHFVKQLKKTIPFYALRFSVKPGVTGWAQVNFRYAGSEAETAEKLCYELFAVQELTPVLYALIVLKTIQTMLLRPGS